MKTLYSIWDDDQDTIFITCSRREDAFKILKEKQDSESWRSLSIKESEVLEEGEQIESVIYYRAHCGLADTEITVNEVKYFPPFDEAPTSEVTEVGVSGTLISCEGRDLEKVTTAIRQFIAKKRYEFEYAVRKVCNVVQPRIEAGEPMSVNMICEESDVAQDTVVKILLLLKKEGFLDIVDPVKNVAKSTLKKQIMSASQAYQQSSKGGITPLKDQQNVGVNQKGAIVPIDPSKPSRYTTRATSSGKLIRTPIKKRK